MVFVCQMVPPSFIQLHHHLWFVYHQLMCPRDKHVMGFVGIKQWEEEKETET